MRRLLRKVYRFFRPEPIPPCDDDTRRVLRAVLNRDSNTADVGCNRGSILREILAVAPSGHHFAFEPIPRLFRLLQRRFPGVECHRLAASDERSTVRFHVFESMDGFSGMVRRQLGNDPGTVREIEVQTDRLDNLVPAVLRIDLIKIDVEGAEYKVLRGAFETIKRCRPVIVFECGRGGLDIYGHAPEQVFDLLVECGLEVRLLAGWDPKSKALTRAEFIETFNVGREYMFVASRPTAAVAAS